MRILVIVNIFIQFFQALFHATLNIISRYVHVGLIVLILVRVPTYRSLHTAVALREHFWQIIQIMHRILLFFNKECSLSLCIKSIPLEKKMLF